MNMGLHLNEMPFISSVMQEGIILRLFVQPNAKQNEWAGIYNDALRLRIVARAVENKANEAVLKFIADFFMVKKRCVHLEHGSHSRTKYILIQGEQERLLTQCYTLYTQYLHTAL